MTWLRVQDRDITKYYVGRLQSRVAEVVVLRDENRRIEEHPPQT